MKSILMLQEPYNHGFSGCHSVQFSRSMPCSPDDFLLAKGLVSFNSLFYPEENSVTKGWLIVSFSIMKNANDIAKLLD